MISDVLGIQSIRELGLGLVQHGFVNDSFSCLRVDANTGRGISGGESGGPLEQSLATMNSMAGNTYSKGCHGEDRCFSNYEASPIENEYPRNE